MSKREPGCRLASGSPFLTGELLGRNLEAVVGVGQEAGARHQRDGVEPLAQTGEVEGAGNEGLMDVRLVKELIEGTDQPSVDEDLDGAEPWGGAEAGAGDVQ